MTWHRAIVGASALVVAVGVSACDFLRVSDPGRYEEEDLLDALVAVGNTAEGNSHKWMNWYVVWQELLGDALTYTGPETFDDQYGLIDDGRVDFNTYPVARLPENTPTQAYNFPDGMAESRWLAAKGWRIAKRAYEEGDSMDAATDFESSFLAAQIKLGWAFNNMYLGLFSCEGVLGSPDDPGGAEMYYDIQIFDSTVSLFAHVIEIMGRIDPMLLEDQERDYLNAARTGRALMRMLGGDYDGAVADASTVPDGFRYEAILGGSFWDWNQVYRLGWQLRYLSLHPWVVALLGEEGVSGPARDPWTEEPDERIEVVYRPETFFGNDDVWVPRKYNSATSGITMVSSSHARLIEAEAMAVSGDYTGATGKLNALRAEVDLSEIPFIPTEFVSTHEGQVGMLDLLLHERFAELFSEGWRQVDLYRFRLTHEVFEALGDPVRRGIGRPTKFPGSAREAWLNPLVANDPTVRCHPNAG